MTKFRKKPIVIEAVQWFKNGDHEKVRLVDPGGGHLKNCPSPDAPHGVIYTLEGNMIVCPGDWIITGVAGEVYPCKDSIFRATYEEVE